VRELQEIARGRRRELAHLSDVAAGAERLAFGAQQHCAHGRIAGRALERRPERLAHVDGQRVHLVRAVERHDRHGVATNDRNALFALDSRGAESPAPTCSFRR
jgi:hypothetical protein